FTFSLSLHDALPICAFDDLAFLQNAVVAALLERGFKHGGEIFIALHSRSLIHVLLHWGCCFRGKVHLPSEETTPVPDPKKFEPRSEEHTSELQSLRH